VKTNRYTHTHQWDMRRSSVRLVTRDEFKTAYPHHFMDWMEVCLDAPTDIPKGSHGGTEYEEHRYYGPLYCFRDTIRNRM
jgi:hypothetical protein